MSAETYAPTTPRPSVPSDHPEAPLFEMAARYPEPDWKETAADRFWLADQQNAGALVAHVGKVVAVYKKQIIGVGDDSIAMLLELSPKYDVHPGRIVCVYLGDWRDELSTPADPPAAVDPGAAARAAELCELEKQFPAPTAEDVQEWIADRMWLNEQQSGGAFDAHYGRVVAVYNKQLIGVGDNYHEMLLELAPKYNVHPERIVGVYLGDPRE